MLLKKVDAAVASCKAVLASLHVAAESSRLEHGLPLKLLLVRPAEIRGS